MKAAEVFDVVAAFIGCAMVITFLVMVVIAFLF